MDADAVHRAWVDRTGEYSPRYYAYYGPNETSERLREHLDAVVGSDAAVLELGCSSGRHLAHLHEGGYGDLRGVDINGEAFEVMAEVYPGLAASGSFEVGAIEDVVPEFDDDQFDAVFSVETLQHVHPDTEWVFAEVARITDDLLVTAEIEAAEDDRRDEEVDAEDGQRDEEVDAEDGQRDGRVGDREQRADGSSPEPGASSESGASSEPGASSGPGVTYVQDEFPLYYWDWSGVFTEFGFVEAASETVGRDTLRVFRPAGR